MRPRFVLLIAVVAVAAAVLFWFAHRSKPPAAAAVATTAATAPGASATTPVASSQHTIQLEINHLGLTAERAKLLFSLTVGPLPGVSLDGLTKDPNEFDGTQAVVYLLHEWRALTPEQRQAAARLIYGSPGNRGRSGELFLPERWSVRPPRVMLAGFGASAPNDLPAHDYQSLADNAAKAIAPLLSGGDVIPHTVDVRSGVSDGTEFAHTTSWAEPHENDPNTGDFKRFADGKCHIIVWDGKFIGADDFSTEEILAHEMTHCYQDAWAGTYANRAAQPRWMADGEADWVGATIVPSGQAIDKYWPPYVFAPKTVYSDRWYDAIGVFGHLSDITSASVVWSRLQSTAVVSENGDDAATLSTFIQGVSTSYYSTWGASYFQDTNFRWKIKGPGSPPASGPAPDDAVINPGTDAPITAAPYQATLTKVSGGSDILGIALLTGYGRVHDQGFGVDTQLDASGPLALCLRDEGCECPQGTEGVVLKTQKARAPISIGIDGGDTVAEGILSGHSLNEFCTKKPEKTPTPTVPPTGGGGGGGGDPPEPDRNPGAGDSVGDPHLKSFDGLRFDFQRIGEYTLVRSTKDDFVVQVRQVPVGTSRGVSFNQEMATKVGGKRVTVALENSVVVLRVDGTIVTGEPPAIPGVSITPVQTTYGTTYVFEWPDGTTVRAEQLGMHAINVRVRPSPARRGTLEGLLGNFDGSSDNDTGEMAALADKWRVPASASLFDYLPGQTSDTFVDPSFPDPSSRVPNAEAAERACREEGVTDAHLLHDCIIDFGVTSGFLFTDQYAHQQKVLEARASLAPLNAKASTVPTQRVVVMAGEITDKSQTPEFSFQAEANDVIVTRTQPECVDRSETSQIWFVLYDPNGKSLGSQPGCAMTRVTLPVAGTYTLKANVPKNSVGKYHIPITFLRHDRVQAIKYGDIVSGNIEQKGAQDRYTFTAQAGDLIQISGKGCQLDMFTAIVSSEGWSALGPLCREGTVYKIPKAGSYTLLVNSDDGGPGKYQFVFQGVSGR